MFGIPQEFLANWFLSEKELRIWYLRSSYDMREIVDYNDERILPFCTSIYSAIEMLDLLSDKKFYKITKIYADEDFRNFICYDKIGRTYWIRGDHTPEEDDIIANNKRDLDNYRVIPVTLEDGLDRVIIRATHEKQPENEYFVAMEIFPNS